MTNPNPAYKKNILAGLSVPTNLDPNLRRFLQSVKQHLELSHGNKGQPKERYVTLDDLQKIGLAPVKVVRGRGELVKTAESEGVGTNIYNRDRSSGGTDFDFLNTPVATQGSVLRFVESTAKWQPVDFFDGDDNIHLTDDRKLIFGFDSDVELYFDNTDFNLVFTDTTDVNFSGVSGAYKFAEPAWFAAEFGIVMTNTTDAYIVRDDEDGKLTIGGGDDGTLFSGSYISLRGINHATEPGQLTFAAGVGGFIGIYRPNASGGEVRIFDGTANDYVSMRHDGADFNFVGVNTTDVTWTGLTGMIIDGTTRGIANNASTALTVGNTSDTSNYISVMGSTSEGILGAAFNAVLMGAYSNDPLEIRQNNTARILIDGSGNVEIKGVPLRIEDSSANDWASFSHNGTDFLTAFTNTTGWDVSGAAQVEFLGGMDVWIRDAGFLRIYDSGDTDFGQFSHDGTDFNFAFTNTAAANFTGANLVLPDSGQTIEFGANLGDKIILYPSAYAIGIESSSVVFESGNFFRWYVDDAPDGGTSALMYLSGNGGIAAAVELRVRSNHDVVLCLEADIDNTGEDHNPAIRFLQDGAAVESVLGQSGAGDVDGMGNSFTGAINNGFALHHRLASGGISIGTGGVAHFVLDGSGLLTTRNTSAQEVGYKGMPINTQNGNYMLVLSDAGKAIYKASGGAGETITIPANSSVAFPVGTTISIVNNGGGTLSIAITTDTLSLAGAGTTGTRTLADHGFATIHKVSSTEWFIFGSGLS